MPYMGNPIVAIVLIIGAIVIALFVLLLGLCVASLFLPVILVLIGLVALWRGAKGNQILVMVGCLLMIVGVALWMWW